MTLLSGEFIAGVTDKVTFKSSPVVKVSGASYRVYGAAHHIQKVKDGVGIYSLCSLLIVVYSPFPWYSGW